MQQIINISKPSADSNLLVMQRIAATSRRNNRRHDLTGILLYSGSHILQVIEGQDAPLLFMLERIARDTRHFGINLLAQRVIMKRRFPDWAMSLVYSLDFADELEAIYEGRRTVDIEAILSKLEPDDMNGVF